jgi:hypothetical protein
MKEPITFDLDLEAYRVQRRPAHAQLVINDSDRGLAVVNVPTGTIAMRIAFPSRYAANCGIDSWCMRADGDAIIAFHDDANYACWFSLRDETSHVVSHPAWPVTYAMPYDWRGDVLWVKDPDAFRFAVLRDAGTEFLKDDGFQALQEDRAWRRATDRLRRANGYCSRVEPEHGRLLYVAVDDDDTRVGVIGWMDEPDLSVQVTKRPQRLAAHQRHLFLLEEYEAQLIDAAGRVLGQFPAPEGFRFVGLDTVLDQDGSGFSLVLVSRALDGRRLTRFSVYPHPDRAE